MEANVLFLLTSTETHHAEITKGLRHVFLCCPKFLIGLSNACIPSGASKTYQAPADIMCFVLWSDINLKFLPIWSETYLLSMSIDSVCFADIWVMKFMVWTWHSDKQSNESTESELFGDRTTNYEASWTQTDNQTGRHDPPCGVCVSFRHCLTASSHGLLGMLLKVYWETTTLTALAHVINCQHVFWGWSDVTS